MQLNHRLINQFILLSRIPCSIQLVPPPVTDFREEPVGTSRDRLNDLNLDVAAVVHPSSPLCTTQVRLAATRPKPLTVTTLRNNEFWFSIKHDQMLQAMQMEQSDWFPPSSAGLQPAHLRADTKPSKGCSASSASSLGCRVDQFHFLYVTVASLMHDSKT